MMMFKRLCGYHHENFLYLENRLIAVVVVNWTYLLIFSFCLA